MIFNHEVLDVNYFDASTDNPLLFFYSIRRSWFLIVVRFRVLIRYFKRFKK